MKTIDELWYGNMSPFEQCTRGDKRLKELLKEILLAHKAQQELYRQQFRKAYSKKHLDMVCVNPLGELIKPSYVTAHFPVLLERSGLRPIRFHDLRHTCASLLVSLNINMKVIQRSLGHSNMSTTADIYSRLFAVRISGKYIIPKSALAEFFVTDFAFEIVHESTWHMNTILLFVEKE